MFGGEIRYAETANPFSIKAQTDNFVAGLVRQVQAAVVAGWESVLRDILRTAFDAGGAYAVDQHAAAQGWYVPEHELDFDAWLACWIEENAG